MKKVLVTAPRGIIGSALVHELVSHGFSVLAGVRHPGKSADLISAGATPILFDFAQSSSFANALSQVECVVLVTPTPFDSVSDCTGALISAISSMQNKPVLVRVSLVGSGSNASFEWGRAHGQADALLAKSNVPHAIVRCSPLFQSFLSLNRWSIDSEGSLYCPLGDASIVMVDAKDISRAITSIIQQGLTGEFTVTGPEALTGNNMVEAVSHATGKQGRYQNVTDKAARHGMTGAGLPESLVVRIEGLHQAYRRGEFAQVSGDFERLTHRRPTSFEEFLKREL